jgi:3-oxoacyl-[acyl-carrier protein] reductase
MKRFGKVDILVNNAGLNRPAPIEDLSEEDWDAAMNVNLKGAFLCSKAVGKVMIQRRSGVVINISSICGVVPEPWGGAYSPSKAGMIMLSQLLAMEWARYQIRVNTICPNATLNGMGLKVYTSQEALELRSNAVPMGRLGKVDDIGKVAVFLASEDSSYITGGVINVDGGQTISLYNFLLKYQPGYLQVRAKDSPALPY